MNGDNVVELVGVEYSTDAIGQRVASETRREVFATVQSVTASEFFAGGQNGLRPDKRFTVFSPDYEGEEQLIFNGRRYSIYRTYERPDEQTELYCELKTGDRVSV